MATFIAARDDNFAAQIFSGQGKSIVILLLAIYELRNRSVQNVLVVTCNDILRDSLAHDIKALCPGDLVGDINVVSSQSRINYGPSDLVIVDEADESLRGIF